jgi:integrase
MKGSAASPGIRVRHSRSCPASAKGSTAKCACHPSVEAFVYDGRESRRLGRVVKIRRTFRGKGALAAAKGWRRDASAQVARGEIRFERKQRLDEVVTAWLADCETGAVLSKRRTRYSPSTIRDYRSDLETYVMPEIGHLAFVDVTGDDVQRIINRMNADGLKGQTVRNVVVALAAFYRTVRRRLATNPCRDLDLPEPGARRERAASPLEAQALLDPLEGLTHDVYAAAFYSGLRRGELQALRVGDIDLDEMTISVVASWDPYAGRKPPKSRAGTRKLPLVELLRTILEVRLAGRPSTALVFGRTDKEPFVPNTIRREAKRTWAVAAVGAFLTGIPLAVELNPIALHEARHSFATWLDHAGVSETRSARYLGHSLPGISDRYRHPRQLAEDRERIEEYLAGAAAGKVVALAS